MPGQGDLPGIAMKRLFAIALGFLALISCRETSDVPAPGAMVLWCEIGGTTVRNGGKAEVETDLEGITVVFSKAVNVNKDAGDIFFFSPKLNYTVQQGPEPESVVLRLGEPLAPYRSYTLFVTKAEGLGLSINVASKFSFQTPYDPSDKFPRIPKDSLLTLVQKRTLAYFTDYAHPVSGLARERSGSGETVTTGGSGFGLMAIIAGVSRGLISRTDGYDRVLKIVDFLGTADRFHGAFPHWMNGSSGAVIPFSADDNGADLVETAFLMQGLLACRQFFSAAGEASLREKITALWEAVEWDWFERNDALFWHWSPSVGWKMNMKISGWNEGLIAYVLGASSPTHSISKSSYDSGWARGGGIGNGKEFYGITLPLGSDFGGPLFFAHYSFLGLDPRGLSDQYANYWEQNVAHARINHAYCAANPYKKTGYSDTCWGITASDIPSGYGASSPTNDTGTIAPTAALASMPYTPQESLAALERFYYTYGDRLFGEYGFHDAFSLQDHWFANSYLAIDQGPIVVMIENYRSGAVWNAFMSDPDVTAGLTKLGFKRKLL